jgi:hypothetical protein
VTDWSALLEDACRFFERHLTDTHRDHLRTRYGLEPAFVEPMRIGYAPADGSALLLHLMDRGYSPDEITGSGLVARWTSKDGARSGVGDLLRGRIVFPYLDAGLSPVYFIGRMTDETPAYRDGVPAKYQKQKVTPEGPREPIFGTWSVYPGDPLIITEGVTDCLAVLQDSRPCISPVTTAFKRERAPEAAAWCKVAGGPVYIINDSEESAAGLEGAVKIAHDLLPQELGSARIFIGTLPRPAGVEKVDLNDFLRSGGDLDAVIAEAIPAEEHPAVRQAQKDEAARTAALLRSIKSRQRWEASGGKTRKRSGGISVDDLKAYVPSISALTGIAPGERGPHPVFGSTHGDNFSVSEDGETWTSFHGGEEKGKGGGVYKLIALMQGFMTDETQPLRGEAFRKTIEYCRERWGRMDEQNTAATGTATKGE